MEEEACISKLEKVAGGPQTLSCVLFFVYIQYVTSKYRQCTSLASNPRPQGTGVVPLLMESIIQIHVVHALVELS